MTVVPLAGGRMLLVLVLTTLLAASAVQAGEQCGFESVADIAAAVHDIDTSPIARALPRCVTM